MPVAEPVTCFKNGLSLQPSVSATALPPRMMSPRVVRSPSPPMKAELRLGSSLGAPAARGQSPPLRGPPPQLLTRTTWRLDSPASARGVATPQWAWGKTVAMPSQRPMMVQTPPMPLCKAPAMVRRSGSAAGTLQQLIAEPLGRQSLRALPVPRPASEAGSAPDAQPACSSRQGQPQVGDASEQVAVLERLKVLLADPSVVAKTLQSCFDAAGGSQGSQGSQGRVPCHAAVRALCTAHTMLLAGLPSTCISETKWRSLLKRAGIYGPEDAVTLDQLREVQAQTLGSLRDCFAPKQLLRSMRRVPRTEPRLKDRYEGFEFRAKGALGKVYRCRHTESQTVAELRQIRKDKVCVPMDYIRTSLHRISELQHPNIPRVVDCLEDFRNFFVISEPVEGLEVMDFMQSSFVRGSTVSEACVADFIRQVLDAASYCHAQDLGPVIHRDLQPEFVLVEDLNREEAAKGPKRLKAWVTSFGLQPLFDLHGLGASLPSSCVPRGPEGLPHLAPEVLPCSSAPEFLAPEVWSRDYGPKCDVWSCGCILFLLLTGRPPFAPRKSISDLANDISSQEPDWHLFRNVSTAALALCKRMLDKDEMTRPTAHECLRHPWLTGGFDPSPEMPLLPETFSALMQSHAQSKFFQVLMNVVASEIKVGRLRLVREAFTRLDPSGSGYISAQSLEVVFKELAVSAQTCEQALRALDVAGTGQIPYTLFIAGCVDLVDDKLDHMLWKVFGMVDEDFSGEIETVVLEHFLRGVLGDDAKSESRRGGDVERYLQSILDCELTASQAVLQIAGDRPVATFEEVKQFVLLAAGDRKEEEAHSQASERRRSDSEGSRLTEREEASEVPPDEASFGVLPELPNFKGDAKAPATPPRSRIKGRVVTGQTRPKHSRKPSGLQ